MDEIAIRVIREYNLTSENIQHNINPQTNVLTNKIVKELFWNIFDNAFKHGSTKLVIIERRIGQRVILEVTDNAGGMSAAILEFLNNPESLSSPIAPGTGLGLIIIRGLSILSNIQLDVINNEDVSGVIGTKYSLGFKRNMDTRD